MIDSAEDRSLIICDNRGLVHRRSAIAKRGIELLGRLQWRSKQLFNGETVHSSVSPFGRACRWTPGFSAPGIDLFQINHVIEMASFDGSDHQSTLPPESYTYNGEMGQHRELGTVPACLAWDPTGRYVALGIAGAFLLFDVTKRTFVESFEASEIDRVDNLAWSISGEQIACTGTRGALRLWRCYWSGDHGPRNIRRIAFQAKSESPGGALNHLIAADNLLIIASSELEDASYCESGILLSVSRATSDIVLAARLDEAKNAEIDDLLQKSESYVLESKSGKSAVIGTNPYGYEVLYRELADMDAAKAGKPKEELTPRAAFDGITFDADRTRALIADFRDMALVACLYNYPSRSVATCDDWANSFEQAAKLGDGLVKVALTPEALRHGDMHASAFVGSGGAKASEQLHREDLERLATSVPVQKLLDVYYPGRTMPNGLKVAETAGRFAAKTYLDAGITEDERAYWLHEYFTAFEKKNGNGALTKGGFEFQDKDIEEIILEAQKACASLQIQAHNGVSENVWDPYGSAPLAFDAKSERIAVVRHLYGEQDRIVVLNLPNLDEVAQFATDGRVDDLSWTANGRFLLFICEGLLFKIAPQGNDRPVKIHSPKLRSDDLDSEQENHPSVESKFRLCVCHPVHDIAALAQNHFARAANEKGKIDFEGAHDVISIRRLSDLSVISEYVAPSRIVDICWSSDGTKLYAVCHDGTGIAYDLEF